MGPQKSPTGAVANQHAQGLIATSYVNNAALKNQVGVFVHRHNYQMLGGHDFLKTVLQCGYRLIGVGQLTGATGVAIWSWAMVFNYHGNSTRQRSPDAYCATINAINLGSRAGCKQQNGGRRQQPHKAGSKEFHSSFRRQ